MIPDLRIQLVRSIRNAATIPVAAASTCAAVAFGPMDTGLLGLVILKSQAPATKAAATANPTIARILTGLAVRARMVRTPRRSRRRSCGSGGRAPRRRPALAVEV